jgi:hypothetical protein
VGLFRDRACAVEACNKLSGAQADGRKLELVLMNSDNHVSFSCRQVGTFLVGSALLGSFGLSCTECLDLLQRQNLCRAVVQHVCSSPATSWYPAWHEAVSGVKWTCCTAAQAGSLRTCA